MIRKDKKIKTIIVTNIEKINILINNIKIQLQTNIFINSLGCYFP